MESTAVSNLYAVYNHAPPPPRKKDNNKKTHNELRGIDEN